MFAGCLTAGLAYLLTTVVCRRQRLCEDISRSIAEGKLAVSLLETLDNNCLLSIVALFMFSYGFPYAVRTPLRALLFCFAIASSCHSAGWHLFRRLDLEGASLCEGIPAGAAAANGGSVCELPPGTRDLEAVGQSGQKK